MSLAEALPGVNDAIDQLNAMNAAIKRRLNVRKTRLANEGEAEANVNIVDLEDESKLGQISYPPPCKASSLIRRWQSPPSLFQNGLSRRKRESGGGVTIYFFFSGNFQH